MHVSKSKTPTHFAPELARYPTQMVPVSRVIDLLEVTHAPGRIAQYREAMARGERFAPVSVLQLGRWYFLADGHKRFTAYRFFGEEQILVELWTLQVWARDQYRQLKRDLGRAWAVFRRRNKDPRTPGDLRAFVRSRLRHWARIFHSLRTVLLERNRTR